LNQNWWRDYSTISARYIQIDPFNQSNDKNKYAYSRMQPLRRFDHMGLESQCNCVELKKLINYEADNGPMGTIFGDYWPGSELLPLLNDPCKSIFGEVDIDWMLRLSWSNIGGRFGTWLDYRVFKFYWNVLRSSSDVYPFETESIFYPSNEMAPYVSNKWLIDGYRLFDIFRPALDDCEDCQ